MTILKKVALAGAMVLASVCSSYASKVATVDMQAVFKGAPQVEAINDKLKKRFHARQKHLMAMQKTLQDDQKAIKKNKPTATKAHLEMLNKNFVADLEAFQKEQSSYKKAVYQAQTEAMKSFTDHVRSVVTHIARKRHIDAVFPERELLYTGPDLDLTHSVLKVLKKDKQGS